VTATYRTDEFGIPTATTGTSSQPFGFTGEPRDATGLTYLRARYYDPSLGRFLSRDPLAGNPRMCQTLNRYAYVTNNPATDTDPSGLKARVLEAQTGFCLGVVVAGGLGLVSRCGNS
jgi:RHS repeat-associated protein